MRRIIVSFLGLLLLLPAILAAGKNDTHITGIVADVQAEPLRGALVILRRAADTLRDNPKEKPKEYHTTTDLHGEYKFDDLEEGEYEGWAEYAGNKSEKKIFELRRHQPLSISFNFLTTLHPAFGGVGQIKAFGKIDLNSARVFVAFASPEIRTAGKADLAADQAFNSIYPTQNDIGAIIYGKSTPAKDVLPDFSSHREAYLLSLYQNTVSLMDVRSREIVGAIAMQASPTWLAFSPDGSRFWVLDTLQNLIMYSPVGEVMGSVNLGENLAMDLAVDGTGSRVYLAARSWPEPMVFVADGRNNAIMGKIALPSDRGQPGGIAVSRDGHIVVVTMGTHAKGWLEVIDMAEGKVVKEIEVGNFPMGVGITPDGAKAVVANNGLSSVEVVDVQNSAVLARVPVGLQPVKVCMRSDGRVAFVTNNGDNSLSVINIEAPIRLIGTVPVGKGPMGVAASADGKTVYVVNHDAGSISVIDGFTLAILGTTYPIKAIQPFGVAIRP